MGGRIFLWLLLWLQLIPWYLCDIYYLLDYPTSVESQELVHAETNQNCYNDLHMKWMEQPSPAFIILPNHQPIKTTNKWAFCSVHRKQKDLCSLQVKSLQIPRDLYHPTVIFINTTIQFDRCTASVSSFGTGAGKVCSEHLYLETFSEINNGHVVQFFRYPVRSDHQGINTSHSRYINTKGVKSLSLKFNNINFCGALTRISVYFHYCPKVKKDLVSYPRSIAGKKSTRTAFGVPGTCVQNAVVAKNRIFPYLLCDEDGQFKSFGKCVCDKGYTRVNESCQVINSMYCPQERVESQHDLYEFPETEAGIKVTIPCQYGGKHNINSNSNSNSNSSSNSNSNNNNNTITGTPDGNVVSRTCNVLANGSAVWSEFNLSLCKEFELIHMKQVMASKSTVTHVLQQFLFQPLLIEGETNTDEILSVIQKSRKDWKNGEVILLIMKFLDRLLNQDIVTPSSSALILAVLEDIVEFQINSNLSLSYSGENIAFGMMSVVQNHVRQVLRGCTYYHKNSSKPCVAWGKECTRRALHSEEKTLVRNMKLPESLLSNLPNTTSSRNTYIYSYAFKDDRVFRTNIKSPLAPFAVDGQVISTTVYNTTVTNLKEPIEITQQISENNQDGICAFWKTVSNDNKTTGYWSNEGCRRSKVFVENDKTFVVCLCDHLTNFAVLFNVHGLTDDDMSTQYGISITSLIGCYISIACLVMTIVCFILPRDLRKTTANKILLNLSVSLLLLLVTFAFGTNHTTSAVVCTSIATLLHLFLLSTFLWMSIEAVSLYKKTVRPIKNRGKNKVFYRVGFILGWGLPIVGAVVTSFFSSTQFKRNDLKYCVITGDLFNFSILLPVSVFLVVNFCLFIPIITKIQGHISKRATFEVEDKDEVRKKRLLRRVQVTVSCTVLLGLTWVFAYLSIGALRPVFQWLFALTNSFQGVFMFLFHVVLNERVPTAWRKMLRDHKRQQRRQKDSASNSLNPTSTRETRIFWSLSPRIKRNDKNW